MTFGKNAAVLNRRTDHCSWDTWQMWPGTNTVPKLHLIPPNSPLLIKFESDFSFQQKNFGFWLVFYVFLLFLLLLLLFLNTIALCNTISTKFVSGSRQLGTFQVSQHYLPLQTSFILLCRQNANVLYTCFCIAQHNSQ